MMGRLASITAHFACVSSFDVGESISHATPGALFSSGDWKIFKKKRHTYDLGTRESWKDQEEEEEERSWKEEADLFCFVLSFFTSVQCVQMEGEVRAKVSVD